MPAWYDNEAGYAARVVDLGRMLGSGLPRSNVREPLEAAATRALTEPIGAPFAFGTDEAALN